MLLDALGWRGLEQIGRAKADSSAERPHRSGVASAFSQFHRQKARSEADYWGATVRG